MHPFLLNSLGYPYCTRVKAENPANIHIGSISNSYMFRSCSVYLP